MKQEEGRKLSLSVQWKVCCKNCTALAKVIFRFSFSGYEVAGDAEVSVSIEKPPEAVVR